MDPRAVRCCTACWLEIHNVQRLSSLGLQSKPCHAAPKCLSAAVVLPMLTHVSAWNRQPPHCSNSSNGCSNNSHSAGESSCQHQQLEHSNWSSSVNTRVAPILSMTDALCTVFMLCSTRSTHRWRPVRHAQRMPNAALNMSSNLQQYCTPAMQSCADVHLTWPQRC